MARATRTKTEAKQPAPAAESKAAAPVVSVETNNVEAGGAESAQPSTSALDPALIAAAQKAASASILAVHPEVTVVDGAGPEIKTNKSAGVVFVANQHMGGITFPMRDSSGMVLPPLRLAPGQVTPVPSDEWERRKKMLVIQHYLDKRLLVEVQHRDGAVPILSESSTDLIIPENLQSDDEISNDKARASIRKANAGEVTIG